MFSRFNLVTRKAGLQGTCLCRKALVTRFYSRGDPSNKDTSPQHLLENEHFWDLPTPKKSPRKPYKVSGGDTVNFRELLDSVIKSKDTKENSYIIEGVAPTNTSKEFGSTDINNKKPRQRTTSLIEQRLLQMVTQQRRIYKKKSPLPRMMIPAYYGKTAPSINEETTFKQNNKTLDSTQLDAIRQNKMIQEHDQGIKTIDDLLSTKSRHHLLELFTTSVMDYQQQNIFPTYYSRLVKNAIYHAYNDFYDPYLAVALFEQCKTMSITSYIEGCTVDVYNQILQIRWEAWKDIYGMLDLMEEMTLNGIGFDKVSEGIVRTIADEMEQLEWSSGENAEQVQHWSPDDIRSTELMKVLVGKWVFK